MNREPHDIIRRPLLTEKSTRLTEEGNSYVFEVAPDANKVEIRRAIQVLFPKVKVRHVRTMRVRAKTTRHRFVLEGRRRGWKKAIVTLQKDSRIEIL